ncbi:hypothetical protein ILUMI_01666 [Ignelater luminosus]|uniref:DRBM domain-containing protein n=1 Tax=Ignelater luminosus TaxID=2038154 RepID=A0A8K0DQ96_IGNLU|nr:hypothetical protein ILUMI_01666 [Ignelater luminosus]
MANNVKTPVMVLQELTVKRSMQTPEYSIIHAKQGTHDNEFHYQVIAANVSAIGVGRSKQVAKHDAARKALDMLQSMGLYNPGETVVKAPRSEVPNSPIRQTINSIGTLSELCVENKIPMPTFTEISDVGPPHCKEFTYQCSIASLVTRATAGTKKQAKQLAAKEMLDRITQVLPELVAECNENFLQAITDRDVVAAERYSELRKFTRPKPNLAIKIEDYDSHIKNIMQEKHITYEDLEVYFQKKRTEESLKALLCKLELDYMIEIQQEKPPIVTLTLNTDVPFVILADGPTIEIAVQGTINKAFQHLEVFSK